MNGMDSRNVLMTEFNINISEFVRNLVLEENEMQGWKQQLEQKLEEKEDNKETGL